MDRFARHDRVRSSFDDSTVEGTVLCWVADKGEFTVMLDAGPVAEAGAPLRRLLVPRFCLATRC